MARGRKMQEAAKEKAHAEGDAPKLKLRVSFRPDEGSLVEVRTDEEGYKGVWYIATVLGMESSHRAYVEYCSLVSDEDSSEPLREFVNLEFIRPLPPREKTVESFEVGHLVDGYYKDGWWTGVITGVLFGGMSFVVTFQDPPDQHVFGSSKLRFHRRWVNGKWEKPGKQDTQSLVFGAGKEVEVCRGDHFIPAAIMEERGNGIYIVNYEKKRETVDSKVIRPCPPPLKDQVFRLGDKVDASLASGWWCGKITKLLPDSSFNVLLESGNHQKRFSHAELRLHLEWNQGNWDVSRDKTHLLNESLGAYGVTSGASSLPQTYRRKRKDVQEEDVPISTLKKVAKETPSKAVVRGSQSNDDSGQLVRIVTLQKGASGDVQGDTEPPQENIRRRRGRPRKISVIPPSGGSIKEAIVDRVTTLDNHSVKDVEIPPQEALINAEQSDVASEQTMEEGTNNAEQPAVANEQIMEEGTNNAEQTAVASEQIMEEGTNNAEKSAAASEQSMEESTNNIEQYAVASEQIMVVEGTNKTQQSAAASEKIMEESTNNIEQYALASEQIMEEGTNNTQESAVACGQIMEEGTNLPFVKTNILWSTVESLEPFQKWPQKPHFRPLQKYDDSCREGRAIGFVVDFCNIVELTSKLEFLNEVKRCDNKLLKVLVDLEENGFDVKIVRDRMAMRESREKLQKQYEEINGEITKQNMEIVELDEMVEELKVQMKKVQEKMSEAMSEKEAKVREVASLQLKLEELRKGMMLPGDSLFTD